MKKPHPWRFQIQILFIGSNASRFYSCVANNCHNRWQDSNIAPITPALYPQTQSCDQICKVFLGLVNYLILMLQPRRKIKHVIRAILHYFFNNRSWDKRGLDQFRHGWKILELDCSFICNTHYLMFKICVSGNIRNC